MTRKIVDAVEDADGNIIKVKIEGNEGFTSVEVAMGMADKGTIEAVHVRPKKTKNHLRTKPTNIKSDNLDEMAKD